MKRFRNILLLNDPRSDERSGLWRAEELARSNGARLTLLDVIPDMPWEADTEVAGVNLLDAVVAERRRHMERILAPLRESGLEVSADVRFGRPFVEVIRKVLADEHDLVIKTAQGSPGIAGRLFGSTALHLMRKCPCPVWIVKPGFRAPHRRVLAAVDPTGGAESLSLDRSILELATSLSQREEGEAHVVHAWRVDDSLLSGRLPRQYVEETIADTKANHENALRDLLASHDDRGISHHVHFERGRAGHVIADKAKEIQADLVVMGTVGRTGISGFFIGSTAEDVLQAVDCSVLTVKPDGFVSPVTMSEEDAHAVA